MSSKDKVAKLEGLLARIKDRAAQPRMNGVTAHAAFAAVEEVDVASPASAPPPAPVVHAAPLAAAPLAQSPTIPPPSSIGSRGTTPPPSLTESVPPPVAAYTDAPPTHSGAPESLDDSEIEVSAEVVELDIDIDEPGLLPAESGSQPVAEYVGSAELDDAEAEALLATAEPSMAPEAIDVNEVTEVAEMSESPEAVPANEVVEPAPSSSPRPIATEEAYEERAPRHTPPPESGKIAAPSVKPDARKASSAPPVEAPPIMSGWPDVSAEVSAPPPPPPEAPLASHVQVAPPPPPPPPPEVHAAPTPLDMAPAFRAPAASGTRLSPDVTRPAYASEAHVANVEGVTPSFAPQTFGDLLDASLDL